MSFNVVQGLVEITDANDNQALITADGQLTVQSTIRGAATGNLLEVSSSGEAKVVQSPAQAPPGTTAFNITVNGDVGGNQNSYSYFIIPTGNNAIIQSFKASAEDEVRSKVELYHDPLGANPTGGQGGSNIPASWVLIDVTHTAGNKNVSPQAEDVLYPGDGAARIALRRKRLDNGSREIFGKVEGYYL